MGHVTNEMDRMSKEVLVTSFYHGIYMERLRNPTEENYSVEKLVSG
jgi:hypothetical protein